MQKKLLGLSLMATLATALTVACASISSRNITYSMNNMKQAVGTSTEYSASLVMRTSYNNNIKYFSYNEETKIGDISNSPTEYTLHWVNGNSSEFSIYTGSTYLDIDTSANKFTNSDTPVYWTMSAEGIGRTIDTTTKYLYYNDGSLRCAPYTDKAGYTTYSPIFFYTDTQLTAWQEHCSGEFAEACLTNIAYTIPTITLYTISFNANGGSGTMASVEKAEGSSYTLPSNDFKAPNGKIFSGWSYEANGEKISTNSITINSNITLYALWKDEITGLTSPATIVPSDLNTVTDSDWTQTINPITFTGNGTITFDQIRVFQGKTLTISSTKTITSIEFTCAANGTAKYGPGCFAAQNGYSYSGKNGIWSGSASSVSFTAEPRQVRITQIIIIFN